MSHGVTLPAGGSAEFGRTPVVGRHALADHPLFTDAALVDLLDHFPRENLYALSMGTDPARADQNRLALHDGVGGAELLRAVRNGRLWLNVTRVDRADDRYRRLIRELYDELAAQVPGFAPDACQGTLLISSPHALVYYHADGPASALWHLRGRKRVWAWPALDPRYLPREPLEDIIAGARHEYLPWEPGFDAGATMHELAPGDWIHWPQNAPHRVTNLDSVNVSLSTEHFTRASRRRARVYVANRFLRTRLDWTGLSAREDGVVALAKTVAHRVVRRLGLDAVPPKRHVPALRVAADAPGGVIALPATEAPIEVDCVHDLARAQDLAADMDALNLAAARPDPFATLAYYRHYLSTGGLSPETGAKRPWLLLARRGGDLVGYLALKQTTRRVLGLPARQLDLLAAHTADRPQLVARPHDATAVSAAMYRYLLGRKRDWGLLEFQQQDADSPLLAAPAAAGAGGCRIRHWPSSPSGTIAIRWDTLAAYFAALSKKARSNISRQMRALMAAGDVRLLTSADPATRALLFQLYRSTEAHSWKARTAAGFGGDGRWEDYYAGLLDPAQPMKVTVQVLLLDGAPIAGLVSGAFGGGLYALHIAHDERCDALGPGSAILLMGVRLAIEGRHAFFNLLRGSGHYKARWLAQMTETRSLQVYRIGSPFFWRRALGDLVRRVAGGATVDPIRDPVSKPRAVGGRPDERERYATLVAQALRGRGEFLSATELAAVLPFATRRVSGRAAHPRAVGTAASA